MERTDIMAFGKFTEHYHLPSGQWGAQHYDGWRVTLDSFESGIVPDDIANELARDATAEEESFMRAMKAERYRYTLFFTGMRLPVDNPVHTVPSDAIGVIATFAILDKDANKVGVVHKTGLASVLPSLHGMACNIEGKPAWGVTKL